MLKPPRFDREDPPGSWSHDQSAASQRQAARGRIDRSVSQLLQLTDDRMYAAKAARSQLCRAAGQ